MVIREAKSEDIFQIQIVRNAVKENRLSNPDLVIDKDCEEFLFERGGLGIGQKLHHIMLDWYFQQTKKGVWLGTAFDTRAEKFYRKIGWNETGTHGNHEIKFEMTYNTWKQIKP